MINVHLFADMPKCLSFAYHMYGSSIGSLSIEQDDGQVINTLWSKNFNMGNQWNYETINVPMMANSKVSFLLRSFTYLYYKLSVMNISSTAIGKDIL